MYHFRKRKRVAALTLTTVILATATLFPTRQVHAQSSIETIQGHVTEVQTARTSDEKIELWKQWAREHAYRIKSITPVHEDIESNSFTDLDMLKPLLQDKRIVFLGESSHGVAELLAKTRLIQFLHKEMGYNVLAFESGLSNTSLSNAIINQKAQSKQCKAPFSASGGQRNFTLV